MTSVAAGIAGVPWFHARPALLRVLLLVVPALIAAGYLTLSRPEGAAAVRQVQSVLAMLNLRSPGERAEGELLDSKQPLANVAPSQRALGKVFGPPQQRALGKIFPPPEDIALPGDDMAFAPPFQPDVLNVAGLPGPAASGAPGGAPLGGGGAPSGGGGLGGGGGPPLGGGGVGGGAGGGGITDDGGDEGGLEGGTIPVSPPVAAVPEPGTWLLMIIAFGLCGHMLRRHRRSQLGQPLCHPAS